MSSAFKKAQKLENLNQSKFDEDLDEKQKQLDLSDDSSSENDSDIQGGNDDSSGDEKKKDKYAKNGIKKITKADLEKKVKDNIKEASKVINYIRYSMNKERCI